MKPINRLLIMLALLVAWTTSAWAQTEEVTVELSESAVNEWLISNMPASNVEVEVEYYSDEEMMSGEGLELIQQDDGTWTIDAMPGFNVELEIEYYPEEYEYTITDATEKQQSHAYHVRKPLGHVGIIPIKYIARGRVAVA